MRDFNGINRTRIVFSVCLALLAVLLMAPTAEWPAENVTVDPGDFTPDNYTPANAYLNSHLAGINAKLIVAENFVGDELKAEAIIGADLLIKKTTTAAVGDIGIAIQYDAGSEYPLVIYDPDNTPAGPPYRISWLNNGSFKSPNSMTIDGHCNFDFTPSTRQVSQNDPCTYDNPDGAGTMPYMLGLGADVPTNFFLRGGSTNRPGTAQTMSEFMLALDRGEDWVWKLQVDGQMSWGDGGASATSATSDGDQGNASFDTHIKRVEDGSGNGYLRVTNDGFSSETLDLRPTPIKTATVAADCNAAAEEGDLVIISGAGLANTAVGLFVCVECATCDSGGAGYTWAQMGDAS